MNLHTPPSELLPPLPPQPENRLGANRLADLFPLPPEISSYLRPWWRKTLLAIAAIGLDTFLTFIYWLPGVILREANRTVSFNAGHLVGYGLDLIGSGVMMSLMTLVLLGLAVTTSALHLTLRRVKKR